MTTQKINFLLIPSMQKPLPGTSVRIDDITAIEAQPFGCVIHLRSGLGVPCRLSVEEVYRGIKGLRIYNPNTETYDDTPEVNYSNEFPHNTNLYSHGAHAGCIRYRIHSWGMNSPAKEAEIKRRLDAFISDLQVDLTVC